MGPTEQQMGGVVAGGGSVVGAAPSEGTPVPSGDTGDIIISSGPDKPKVSRPLMLGIIIGVLVLIGGAVAAVILLNQGKSGGSVAVSNTDLYAAFDDYAVYIVGSEEDYNEGFDINKSYALNDILYSDSENDQEVYINVAIQKLDKAIENYNKLGLKNNDLGELLNSNLENLKFLELYVKTNILTGQDIFEKYEAEGEEAARAYVEGNYEELLSSSSVVANNFANMAVDFGNLIISASDDASEQMTSAVAGMNSLVNSTVSSIVDNCWILRDYISDIRRAE